MSRPVTIAALVISVSLLGAVISLSRLLFSNREALSNLVWAEDGLFPLCIQVHDYFTCLIDPYEGYLLFVSRTLALPVALFDLTYWPLATNLVAAGSAGVAAGVIAWLLLRAGVSPIAAGISGLVTVAIPIAGLEAINVSGSVYMALLVIATILVSFRFSPSLPPWLAPVVLLITGMTIPSSLVLIIPLLVSAFRERRRWSPHVLAAIGLLVGLAIQAYVVVTAPVSRPIALTADTVKEWVSYLPTALSTLVPNHVSLEVTGRLESAAVPPSLWQGVLLLLIIGFVVGLLLRSSNSLRRGAGWLLLTGLLLGAFPAAIGYSNNRYFVVPLIALLISLLVIFDSFQIRYRNLIIGLLAVATFIFWWPSFGASTVRSGASPSWNQMLDSVRSECATNPSGTAALVFTPNWPFDIANFQGPTNNVVPCEVLLGNS